MKKSLIAMLLGLSLVAPLAVKAELNDPLLKKLVDKGTLTSEEAQEIQSKNPLNDLKIGGVIYFDYSFGQTGGATTADFNRFSLQRAYININKEIAPWFKARITPDIKTAATTTGDYTVRMKYAYADFLAPDMGLLTDTDIRAGLAQLPLLDFEESLNGYRMQSALFQDKRGLITSSDAGIGILGNIGGKLNTEQVAGVGNKNYAGKYGSYHIGIYNGGGYSSAAESNQNKSVQGRITVRPLPEMLPGLQLTYFGISGEGNNSTGKPKQWSNNTGLISYQHKHVTAYAEYLSGKGNKAGDDELKKSGFSLFGKMVLPMYEKVAFFGRYDSLDPDTDNSVEDKIETTIAGASYRIKGENYLVAAFEKTSDASKVDTDDTKGQLVLQVAF